MKAVGQIGISARRNVKMQGGTRKMDAGHQFEINAGRDMDVEARRDIKFKVTESDIKLLSGANMRTTAGENWELEAGRDIEMNSGGNLEVNSHTNSGRVSENNSDWSPTVSRFQGVYKESDYVIGQPLSPYPGTHVGQDIISQTMMDQ